MSKVFSFQQFQYLHHSTILVLVVSGLNQCITMERTEERFCEWLWTVAPHAVLREQFSYEKLFSWIPWGCCPHWPVKLSPFQWDMAKFAVRLLPYSVRLCYSHTTVQYCLTQLCWYCKTLEIPQHWEDSTWPLGPSPSTSAAGTT